MVSQIWFWGHQFETSAYSFIHPFNKYLLRAYYELRIHSKQNKDPLPHGTSNSERTNLNTKHKKIISYVR